MAAMYTSLGLDPVNSTEARSARCFMHHQLGYLTNHLCDSGQGACNTGSTEGFSYLIGCALFLSFGPVIECVTETRCYRDEGMS